LQLQGHCRKREHSERALCLQDFPYLETAVDQERDHCIQQSVALTSNLDPWARFLQLVGSKSCFASDVCSIALNFLISALSSTLIVLAFDNSSPKTIIFFSALHKKLWFQNTRGFKQKEYQLNNENPILTTATNHVVAIKTTRAETCLWLM
jgi:hypothetical protein